VTSTDALPAMDDEVMRDRGEGSSKPFPAGTDTDVRKPDVLGQFDLNVSPVLFSRASISSCFLVEAGVQPEPKLVALARMSDQLTLLARRVRNVADDFRLPHPIVAASAFVGGWGAVFPLRHPHGAVSFSTEDVEVISLGIRSRRTSKLHPISKVRSRASTGGCGNRRATPLLGHDPANQYQPVGKRQAPPATRFR
jgi:hypothetical protein